MNPALRRTLLLSLAALAGVMLIQGCSSLEPLPRFRTSSTSFAPDQLPLAQRSVSDLVDPTTLGAYSALKERALEHNSYQSMEGEIINKSPYTSVEYKDVVGLNIDQIRDDLAEEEEDPSEEPVYDEAVFRHVMDRAYLNSVLEETVELNPAINRVALMTEIINLLGVRYRYGGNDAVKGLDCSAFTGTIYSRALGVRLPRSSAQQFNVGDKIKIDELKIGDLVFFRTRRRRAPVSHVGIYVGEKMFAHASSRNGVIISTLADGYYKRKYVGARRVLDAEFTSSGLRLR